MVVSSGAVSFLRSSTVARAADPVVLSPNTSVNEEAAQADRKDEHGAAHSKK